MKLRFCLRVACGLLAGSLIANPTLAPVPDSLSRAKSADADLEKTVAPYVIVLGIAQDGGVPQAGTKKHPGWKDPEKRRRVVCLGLVDPKTKQRWMFEATPDFPEQLHMLDEIAPTEARPSLAGIFLTHAHIGHYTGLMYLGLESMGAKKVPVFAMPKMSQFLSTNGPWSQLVKLENIALQPIAANKETKLNDSLVVTPLLVPHRQEFSEVVGFRIKGPTKSVLFIPDIDSWEDWDRQGTRIENEIAKVDIAYLDGTFFANGEIPGRDMSRFPHPFVRKSMERFVRLAASERAKIRFIHFNHTNQALWKESAQRKELESAGFHVAEEKERIEL